MSRQMELIVSHAVDYVTSSLFCFSTELPNTRGAAKTASGKAKRHCAVVGGTLGHITDCDELGTFPPHVRISTQLCTV